MSKPVPKLFKYTLYYGDQAKELPDSPDGWQKTTVEYNRSEKYGGLLRALTLPYTFVRDAATLLRKIYYIQNAQALSRFNIDKRNNKWGYDRIFTGKIDFKTKTDRKNGFEVSAIEDGITAKLDAQEDVTFALPLVGADVIDVTLTPLILREKATFIYYPSNDYRSDAFFVLSIVNNDQLATQASVQNSGFKAVDNPNFANEDQWFYIARAAGNVQVKGNISGFVGSETGLLAGEWEINFYKSDNTLVKTVYYKKLNSGIEPFSADFDFTVPMQEGERLFCFFRNYGSFTTNSSGFLINTPLNSEGKNQLEITYNTQSPASTCKGILAKDVYKRLIAEIDPTAVPQSNMLANEFGRLVYTSSNSILTTQVGNLYQAGDSLQIGGSYLVYAEPVTYVNNKGITTVYQPGDIFKAVPGFDEFTSAGGGFVRLVTGAPEILISLTDFFQDFVGMKCGQVAMGMDGGKICLEDLSYFYRGGLLTQDLGKDISGFEATPNLRRMYTSIKVGQEDQQYNALNGSQEVQSEQQYTTPYENNKLELNAVCATRCDPFGIEEIRAITPNVDGNTAASRSDNDVWRIWLHQSENRPLTLAEGTQSFSGADGSYYNWRLTPKQNLLRGSRFLASCLDRLNGQISFKSGKKNVSLVTVDFNGRRVAESEDVNISDLGTKIFRPELFSFTCGNPDGASLLTRPYGEVRFNFDGIELKGFINDVAVDEGSQTAQKFTLECCGDVDLTKLIR